jgi:beta-lactam-binding protein with PASTA domain
MSPASGQKYAPSQQITLYYSGGGIQVPQVTGLSLNSALQELKAEGFTAQPSIDESNGPVGQDIPVGTVWNQFPAEGKTVPANTPITLFVQQTAATPSTSPSGTPSGTPTATSTPTASSTPSGTPTASGTPTGQ